MYKTKISRNITSAFKHNFFLHSFITCAAVGIAFALPMFAEFILREWWPVVDADSKLLLFTKIGLTTVLTLFFSFVIGNWGNPRYITNAKSGRVSHIRCGTEWLRLWRERQIIRKRLVSDDAFVMTLTGFNTFSDANSPFKKILETSREIKIMLLNPTSSSSRRIYPSGEHNSPSFYKEIATSILYLDKLRKEGKKVFLKFYDHRPFWRVVVLGEQVWVQYYHDDYAIKFTPEYVFALNRLNPKVGLFVPFYMHFLENWDDPQHPEFDFETRELVYRDFAGNEVQRFPFLSPNDHNHTNRKMLRVA